MLPGSEGWRRGQVSKWFDSGSLKGFRVPASKDRRIPRQELVTFMRQNKLPLKLVDEAAPPLLLVTSDPILLAQLRLHVPSSVELIAVKTSYDAGECLFARLLCAAIVDLPESDDQRQSLCRELVGHDILTFVIVADLSQGPALRKLGVADVFSRPFDPQLLMTRIMTMAGYQGIDRL